MNILSPRQVMWVLNVQHRDIWVMAVSLSLTCEFWARPFISQCRKGHNIWGKICSFEKYVICIQYLFNSLDSLQPQHYCSQIVACLPQAIHGAFLQVKGAAGCFATFILTGRDWTNATFLLSRWCHFFSKVSDTCLGDAAQPCGMVTGGLDAQKVKYFKYIWYLLCDACCCNGIVDLELTCKEKIQRGSELRTLEAATF